MSHLHDTITGAHVHDDGSWGAGASVPTITSLTALSGTELSVAWTGTATEYRLNGGTATALPDGTSPDTLSGLTPNTEYTVELRDGAGAWSTAAVEWTDNTGTGGGEIGHLLTAADCTQASTSGTGAITQVHILAAADCTQAAASSSDAISIPGDGSITLAAAACAQAAASSSAAITQIHVLLAANCTRASTCATGAIVLGDLPTVDQWPTLPPRGKRLAQSFTRPAQLSTGTRSNVQ